MGAQCTGIDIEKNFKLKNKKNFNLYNLDANTFLKNCKKKFDIIFLFEFLEHLEEGDKHKLFERLIKILNKNALIFMYQSRKFREIHLARLRPHESTKHERKHQQARP